MISKLVIEVCPDARGSAKLQLSLVGSFKRRAMAIAS